jgi:hypothetical protein
VKEKKEKEKISFLFNGKLLEITFLHVLNDLMIFPIGKTVFNFPLIDIKIVPALAKSIQFGFSVVNADKDLIQFIMENETMLNDWRQIFEELCDQFE